MPAVGLQLLGQLLVLVLALLLVLLGVLLLGLVFVAGVRLGIAFVVGLGVGFRILRLGLRGLGVLRRLGVLDLFFRRRGRVERLVERLLHFAAGAHHRRREDRLRPVTIAHEIQLQPVGRPGEVALAGVGLGHPPGRALVLDVADVDLAVRDVGHHLLVWAQGRLADLAIDALEFVVVAFVLIGGDGERHRLGARRGEIERVQGVPHREHRLAAVGGNVQGLHVVLGEVRQRRRLAVARLHRHAIDVDAFQLPVGEVDDYVVARPGRLPIVAGPVGQFAERAAGAVPQPHVAGVGPEIVTPAPRRSAAGEEHLRAVRAHARVSAKGIVETDQVAAGQAAHVGARSAIGVAFAGGCQGEHGRSRLVHAITGERAAVIHVGHLADVRAVRLHDVEVRVAVAVGLEGDLPAIRAPGGSAFIAGVHGESDRVAAVGRHEPEVAAPGEDDPRAVPG